MSGRGRAATGVLAVLFVAAAAGVVPSGSAAALAARMALVSQTPYSVAADGTVEFVIALPPSIDLATVPEATLVVTAYRPALTRSDVRSAQTGDLPRSVDSVDLPLSTLVRPVADQVSATITLETITRTAAALQIAQPGLYPVVLELRDAGEVVAELLTFIHRLPSATDDAEVALPVAMAMTTKSPVVMDDAGDVMIDEAIVAELTQLADILEASEMPVAVRVPPGLLLAVRETDEAGVALAERLRLALARNEVLSSPRYPLDPSQAAAAAQNGTYTQWLRDGEDDLTTFMSNLPSNSVAFMEGPLSARGGALLRDLGTRLIVTTPEVFDPLPNSTGGFTDSSQLVQVEVAPGVTVDVTLIDRELGAVLERRTTTPTLTGIYAVTNLLAYRQEIVDNTKDRNGNAIGDPSRRGVTLGTSDLSLPNTESYRAIATLLTETPGLLPTTLEALGVRTDHLSLEDRGEVIVGLPEGVDGSIDGRVATVTQLTEATFITGSMLPTDDPRLASWRTTIDRLPTSALTDQQVDSFATGIYNELAAIRDDVVIPSPFKFTLTGKKTTVPIRLYNQGDVPLAVRVHISSSKLPPQDDVSAVIPPQSYAPVDIVIEARTNGTFPVTLTVLTPSGDILDSPVQLTAKVTALSGLGNLFTGAFLLVVLTWWVRHVRQNRRNRAAAIAAARHPVGQAIEEPAEAALSPDAATSTLPPS